MKFSAVATAIPDKTRYSVRMTTNQGVFTITRPPVEAPSTPLIFASPHSGRVIPVDMQPANGLGPLTLSLAEDAFVNQLVGSGPSHGATLIQANISRSYLDLNRSAEDLDPALIDDVSEVASPKTAAGFGVIPRLAGDGTPLYDRRLPRSEAEHRLQSVHEPYHAALSALMAETHARHGQALLIDWHSMPTRAAGVEVVIGDRHGSSCTAQLSRRLRDLFENLGWRVALNRPYAGGWTTRHWGRPLSGYHAIQIELSRGLYLNESTLEPNSNFMRTRKALDRVIASLCQSQQS